MCYAALLTRPCPRFCFRNSLANWMNTKTGANSIKQSRTVCASRKSWNANQLTVKSKKIAGLMSKTTVFDMFILLVIDLFHESIRLCGGLGCLPRVLDYGSNFTEAGAADGASAGNACHLLHLLGRSTKQTVLRLLAEVLFENVDAK